MNIFLLKDPHEETNNMKLVNIKTRFVVVEFVGEETRFFDPFLENEMKRQGIAIPPFFKKEFGGRSSVRLKDKDFQKAFKEIYYKLSVNHQTYHWEI